MSACSSRAAVPSWPVITQRCRPGGEFSPSMSGLAGQVRHFLFAYRSPALPAVVVECCLARRVRSARRVRCWPYFHVAPLEVGRWAAGSDLHSKSRVLDCKPSCVEELRPWHFDGSQTGQAPAASSAVYLRPRAIYPDPVRGMWPLPFLAAVCKGRERLGSQLCAMRG